MNPDPDVSASASRPIQWVVSEDRRVQIREETTGLLEKEGHTGGVQIKQELPELQCSHTEEEGRDLDPVFMKEEGPEPGFQDCPGSELDGTREEEGEGDTGRRPLQKKRPTCLSKSSRASRPVPAVLEKTRRGRSASSSAGRESPSPPSLSYPCPHCQTCFTGELYLERHVKKSHREQYLQLLRNRTGANLSSLHSKQKRSQNPAVRKEPLSPWEQTNPEPERSLGAPVKDGRGDPAGRAFCTCREAALHQRENQRDTKRQKTSRQGPSEAPSAARRFLRMLLEADVPLEKAEHPSALAFLEAWGSVGSPRDCLPDLYAEEREGVRVRLRGRALAVCVEELSDAGGGSILNVLAAPVLGEESRLGRAYLLQTRFCAAVSPSAVAQLVVQSLSRYEIGFEDVRVLDTDGSACMRGSYVHVLRGLLTNCVHVTCLGRVVEAVLGAFQKPFRLAARYAELFQRLLAAPGGGRSRYRQCLREVNPTAIAPALPEPLHTSWSSGVTAAQHHSEHLGLQREFVEREMERSPCSTLRSLQEILLDSEKVSNLQSQLSFLSEKSARVTALLGRFRPGVPVTTDFVDTLEELRGYLESQRQSCEEAETPLSLQSGLSRQFHSAFQGAASELDQYVSGDTQPAYEFLKAARIFDPAKVQFLSQKREDYTVIPGWDEIPNQEFQTYRQILAPEFVANRQRGADGERLEAFWRRASLAVPGLSRLALSLLNAVVNWTDPPSRPGVRGTGPIAKTEAAVRGRYGEGGVSVVQYQQGGARLCKGLVLTFSCHKKQQLKIR
ncbi:uncharacterized protein LOC117407692 isoform X2 [Acipenser ruthenus]|uniref:uncharacterized protein LOC117407692 isoform X2 n=1 Tax=Acipenser ruthenus TaxID=7906 RepID=UPI002741146C|nr:uncharacterized protein LOC117407692 isoform X2 [Acipenser ruthenus]